ncbi:MAG TPA: lipocalin-like domain-containing protein [Chryseolinea sp.]
MKCLTFLIGFVTVLTLLRCGPKQSSAGQFHGMWRLDKFEVLDTLSNSWSGDSVWARWTGYILYDGEGHMGVHLSPPGYKEFDTSKSIDSLNTDELKALAQFYQSNFVYFADYVTTDTTIEHKRLSATDPTTWGRSLVRDFEFRGDTLVLTAHERIGGQKLRLKWIKL